MLKKKTAKKVKFCNKFTIFANMIELAQHIEILLLENDCVIVPGFGGFVAHYAPAVRVEHENLFLPPMRTIGFNPQLRLNDGVLVQSYMNVYDTNFSDAAKRIEKEVSELIATLHEDGKIDLINVGEVRYTIHDTYEFVPYDHKITTPYLYGLDSFEMKELSALQQPKEKVLTPVVLQEKKSYEIRINRALLRNAVAIVAAVALFFFLSTPIENTYVEKENYAQLLPSDLFEKIEKQSVATTPIVIAKKTVTKTDKKQQPTVAKPIAVKEIKVAKTPSVEPVSVPEPTEKSRVEDNRFHIIVAGGVALKNAETLVTKLKAEGFENAAVLHSDGKIRVSIMSYATNEEATKQMLQLRKNEAYQNAWLLAK